MALRKKKAMGTSGNNSEGTFVRIEMASFPFHGRNQHALFPFHVRNQSRCGSFFMQKSMHEIFHPNNSQVLQNHWANESPAWWWYLVLTSSGLIVKGRFVTCAGCWGVVYPLLAPGQNQNIIICV
jgi:hypothetical protein